MCCYVILSNHVICNNGFLFSAQMWYHAALVQLSVKVYMFVFSTVSHHISLSMIVFNSRD